MRLLRSTTFRFVLRRVGQAIPVLFGVTFITYCLLNLLPGNVAQVILGQDATPASLKALTLRLGLNEGFFPRYGKWLFHALGGNFGQSLADNQPVSTLIGQRLPVSLELILFAFLISLACAIPVAVLSAGKPRHVVDRAATLFSTFFFSVPSFVVGLIFILIFSLKLHIFPPTGYVPLATNLWENVHTMLLPSITLAAGLFAGYVRLLRSDLVDQMLGEDYIVTARSKGVPHWQVLVRHALRNSVFGLITVVGLNVGTLIGGTVIIEQIFAVPGLGQLLISSVNARDAPVVQGLVVLLAVFVTIGNLSADVLYAVLDPRIRYGRRET